MTPPLVSNPLRPAYSQAEREIVCQMYPAATQAALQDALPGRTWESICSAAYRFGIARTLPANFSRRWSIADEELLRLHYPANGADFVAKLVGRKTRTVLSHAGKLGIRRDWRATAQAGRTQRRPPRPNDWTVADKALLSRLYKSATKQELFDAFAGRSWWGIQCQARKQALRREHYLPKLWSAQESEVIRAHYPTLGAQRTAALLPGRTEKAVRKQACLLSVLANRTPTKIKQKKLKRARAEKAKATKVAKAAKVPKPKPVVAAPEPIKRSPNTPVLNARLQAKQLAKKKATPLSEILSAMKKPDVELGRRDAFTKAAYHGMPAAIKAWDEWTPQQQAA